MDGFGIDATIADRGTRDRAAAWLAKAGVKLPTFAELAAPRDIADRADATRSFRSIPILPIPPICFASIGTTTAAGPGFYRRRPIWCFLRR